MTWKLPVDTRCKANGMARKNAAGPQTGRASTAVIQNATTGSATITRGDVAFPSAARAIPTRSDTTIAPSHPTSERSAASPAGHDVRQRAHLPSAMSQAPHAPHATVLDA